MQHKAWKLHLPVKIFQKTILFLLASNLASCGFSKTVELCRGLPEQFLLYKKTTNLDKSLMLNFLVKSNYQKEFSQMKPFRWQ
jgi:hypothetical protein